MEISELKKRKAELAAEIGKQSREYQDRRAAGKDAWPDGTKDAWEQLNSDYDANERALIEATNDETIKTRAEQIRKDMETSTRGSNPKPGLDDRIPGEDRSFGDAGYDRDGAAEFAKRQRETQLAFRSWMVGGRNRFMSDEMRDACIARKMNPADNEILVPTCNTRAVKMLQRAAQTLTREQRQMITETGELPDTPAFRALSKVTATAGPELVPVSFANTLELAMLSYGDMLAYVDQLVTATGEDMKWTLGDDTANEGAWVAVEGEDTQVIGEPNPIFRQQTWSAYELHSKWIKVPIALNEDSMWDLEFELAKMIGIRLGRARNNAATVGDGVGKSKGIVLDAAPGVTSALAAAIGYADIVKLEHSVDPAVRNQSYFMFHDSILQAIRLLLDSQNRPLWQASMRDATPDRLHNRPYVYNQHMVSTIATTNVTMLFGRLSDYKERRVRDVRILRANERFAEKLQIAFLGYIRVDGKLQRPTANGPTTVKKLTQA